MWSLLNRYALPPLAPRLSGLGAALNQRAQRLLEPASLPAADAERLARTLAANAACWQLLRFALPKSRRRLLQRHLQRQAPWRLALHQRGPPPAGSLSGLAGQARSKTDRRCLKRLDALVEVPPSPALRRRERRALARLLETESTWLEQLEQGPVTPDPTLLAALLQLYRRARRAVTGQPRSSRAHRRLTRLVLAEELIFAGPGPNSGTGAIGLRRRLLELLDQNAWLVALEGRCEKGGDLRRLGKLVGRRQRALRDEIGALAAQAFAEDGSDYRRCLPWRTFLALADAEVFGDRIANQGERM